MKRGDVVTVALRGDYGKPRPAIIIQTDAIPDSHESVVVVQLTSDTSSPADFRVPINPSSENGLQARSHIMADKPTTIRRNRVGRIIGRLADHEIARLDIALALVLGLMD